MFARSLVAVATVATISAGCVSPEKYNALKIERDGINEQLTRAQQDASAARAQAASWRAQLDQMNSGSGSLTGLVETQNKQIADLQTQLADITAKYNDAVSKIGQGAPLPAALTNELTTFADQNPDLVEFDAKTGIVKFKSDLTFASGDATLQENAKSAIARFATILNSPEARGYELMVAGHADNQKVSAGTAARGHKDNWYLSAHRALSVAEALQQQNVNPKRIGAVGYGEYRPVAPNDNKADMAKNRRVEVLILPTQVTESTTQPAAATPAPARRPAAPARSTTPARNDNDAMNK